jgi:precorrin-6Y C5,15-methyltransferase (decarboxylating)
MKPPVHLIGLAADGPASLSARALEALRQATFVAGGRRHLGLVEPRGVESLVVTTNLEELAARLEARRDDERCVVLASGDPLCFGIGRFLGLRLSPGSLDVEPALSSLQLAFARVVRPWSEARIASVHGRSLPATLTPLLGLPLIGLFTHDGTSPAAVARYFLDRGLDDYTAWVGEDLGGVDERMTRLPLAALPGHTFRDLNFLILERLAGPPELRPVLPDDARFSAPSAEASPRLLTHRDVRAIALSRFHELPAGPLWDIGAGLGGMAVGLANAFPAVEVVAVERSRRELEHLGENRRRFAAWNLRIVEGSAPEALADEPPPAGVFLGGSGGRLDPILDLVLDRLQPGGRLVANFVGLENLGRTLSRLRGLGWPAESTLVQVSQGADLAGLTSFVPQRPVWVVSAARPEV